MIDGFDVPTGRRLGDDGPKRPPGWFATINGLPAADDDRIEFASRYFTQASEDDFEREGRYWIDKATGGRYVIANGDPLLAADPRDLGITAFVVRDDCLIFLKTPGHTSVAKSVQVGTIGGLG